MHKKDDLYGIKYNYSVTFTETNGVDVVLNSYDRTIQLWNSENLNVPSQGADFKSRTGSETETLMLNANSTIKLSLVMGIWPYERGKTLSQIDTWHGVDTNGNLINFSYKVSSEDFSGFKPSILYTDN